MLPFFIDGIKMKIIQPCAFNDVCACCNEQAPNFVSVPVQTIEERFDIVLCRECLINAAEMMLTVAPKPQLEKR